MASASSNITLSTAIPAMSPLSLVVIEAPLGATVGVSVDSGSNIGLLNELEERIGVVEVVIVELASLRDGSGVDVVETVAGVLVF